MMTLKESLAAQYIHAGFNLFPCKENSKEPAVKKWHKKSFPADQLPAVFGVILQDNHLVLDVDPRRYEQLDQWEQLQTQLKDFFDIEINTFTVQTPGGGWHFYFHKPAPIKVRSRIPGRPAIECKTRGQYVCGAGSTLLVKDAMHVYRVINKDVHQIQECPLPLLRIIERPHLHDYKEGSDFVDESQAARERFVSYLTYAPPAREGERNQLAYMAAIEGRNYGLEAETVYYLMRDYYNVKCIPPLGIEELYAVVQHAYTYAKGKQGANSPLDEFDFDTKVEGYAAKAESWIVRWEVNKNTQDLKPVLSNALNFWFMPPTDLRPNLLYNLVKFNLHTRSIEFSRQAPWHTESNKIRWEEIDTIQFKALLSQDHRFNPSNQILWESTVISAMKHRFHPVKEWLDGLEWDGTPRLDKFLHVYAGAEDNEFHRQAGRATLIGAVARIYDPGCKFDYMLVLEGLQGKGKSTFVYTLGGAWYADIEIDVSTAEKQRDTAHRMQEGWILEASELECTKHEAKALRRFLTVREDIFRLPYERLNSRFPRQSIFIGTVNPEASGYLKDRTGNRRFWCIPCSRDFLNIDGLARDREQLFAEALHYYRMGEEPKLTREMEEWAEAEANKRVEHDLYEDLIVDHCENNSVNQTTTEEIGLNVLGLPLSRIDRSIQMKIANALTKQGFLKQRIALPGGMRRMVWVRLDPFTGMTRNVVQ